MAITARSENRSSVIVDLEQVLIHFISENGQSASLLRISRVQAMTRIRWMFGKASSSQAPSASKSLFGSYLSVDCQSVFHLLTSFPRHLGNGMSSFQNSMLSISSSSRSGLLLGCPASPVIKWVFGRRCHKVVIRGRENTRVWYVETMFSQMVS